MKYIVLSFDDGRKDFYTNAFRILKKYALTATLNVITDFVGRTDLNAFESGNNEAVTWDEISEMHEYGIEIANHSANHSNEIDQITKGVDKIKRQLGINNVGFASPNSEINEKNIAKYKDNSFENTIAYIRSGNQIRRDGKLITYMLSKLTKSPWFYYLYNKRNFINIMHSRREAERGFYPSITCNRDNSIRQLKYLIEKLPDNNAAIIMFHSILKKDDAGWGKDRWFNSVGDFSEICKYLSGQSDVKVITNMELDKLLSEK